MLSRASAIVTHPDGPPRAREGESFGSERVTLPLNIIVMIMSYLDDPADLARACRTCRILHYMCLPALYKTVTLRSYDHIRYSEETAKPEGAGGGSPFSMGLNALITRNVVGYVESFEVAGEWTDHGMEENARAGRVSDGGMMLALLIRAAIDRMTKLKSFSWTLSSKMLPSVWQGLAACKTLQSLTIRFPSSRLPTAAMMAPAIPNLRYLKVTDIDPLCYPDNISDLLYHSRKIEHLKLHFSPRMRLQREPSISLQAFFGKVQSSPNYRMSLKTFAMQNVYAQNEGNYKDLYIPEKMEEFTLIDSAGGVNDEASLSFVHVLPAHVPRMSSLKLLRGNKVSKRHISIMSKLAQNLQQYYLITGKELKDRPLVPTPQSLPGDISHANTPHSIHGALRSPSSAANTPYSQPEHHSPGSYNRSGSSYSVHAAGSPMSDAPVTALGPMYLETICATYGRTLTHLLLLPQWRLSNDRIVHLAQSCPHLTQVGFATEERDFHVLSPMVKLLPNLEAVRILDSPENWGVGEIPGGGLTGWQQALVGSVFWTPQRDNLRWLGLGELVFEFERGSKMLVELENGEQKVARKLTRVLLNKVRDVDIWSKDRLEI